MSSSETSKNNLILDAASVAAARKEVLRIEAKTHVHDEKKKKLGSKQKDWRKDGRSQCCES